MSQDTNINNLIINKLTQQQYDGIQQKNPNEFYLITDANEPVKTTVIVREWS